MEVRELTGGLSNRTVRVTTTDAGVPLDLVVRPRAAGLLGTDRDREHRNTVTAATTGAGPAVVEFVPPDGPLAVAYLDARPLRLEDLRADLARVAALCRRLHGGPRFEGDLDVAAVQQRDLLLVDDHRTWRPRSHSHLGPVVARVVAAMDDNPVPTVPCHNDLPGGNVLDDGRRLWLVDFEFAANNDPWFELGNLASGAALDHEQVEELVAAYDGGAGPERVARTRLWSAVCSWTWVLWASLQDAFGEVDHDYRSMADGLHAQAQEELSRPDLDRLLARALTAADRPR